MTGPRPPDWTPLGTTDPVPGEPDRIAEEARRLRDTAAEMRDQIARLRSIGQDGASRGESADTLRTAATELGGRLERTVGRYEQVAGVLGEWEPVLRQAQDESVRILERAKTAEQTRLQNLDPPAAGGPPTPEQAQQEQGRERARDGALVQLAGERRKLDDLVDDLEDAAAGYSNRIDAAVDDSVADSGWDDVQDFYDRHHEWIDVVTDVASYVATAVAVAAIFIAVPLAVPLVLGGLVLASQALLAGTGHGSWADVGLSVFGLVTLGAGAVISKGVAGVRGLSGLQQATRAAGVRASGKAAEKAALSSTSAQRAAAGRTLVRRNATAAQRAGARRVIDEAKDDARDAARTARGTERGRELTRASVWERVKTGDAKGAHEVADVRGLQTRFPDDPRIAEASAGVEQRRVGVAASAYGGLGVDSGDKSAEDGGLVPGYGELKEGFTRKVGSTW